MAALKKYMFDLDFDAMPPELPPMDIVGPSEGEGEPMVEAEAPPPLTFTEFEMEEMKRLGFAEGHDAGVAEASEVTERRHAEALAALAAGFAAVMAAQRDAIDMRGRESIHLVVAIIKKLYPEMARLRGTEEITGVIHECLMQVDDATRLTVRAHPDLLESVRTEAARVAEEAEFDGKMQFVADPKLALGDCRVEWGNGGADRDQALLWGEIDAIVARAVDGMQTNPGTAPAAH